jgi:hypothetical protein
MPTMRHPRVDGPIEAPESALTIYRMSGWVTEDEAPDLFPEPEDEPDDDTDAGSSDGDGEERPEPTPEPSGGSQSKASRRPRASSKESE